MRDFMISIAVGISVATAWSALWILALRLLGIPTVLKTPEELAARRERILGMGGVRYVLLFGVFGMGFGFGLGLAAAGLVGHDPSGWGVATVKLIVGVASFAFVYGVRAWSGSFADNPPFPLLPLGFPRHT